jgi:hypothetical protein
MCKKDPTGAPTVSPTAYPTESPTAYPTFTDAYIAENRAAASGAAAEGHALYVNGNHATALTKYLAARQSFTNFLGEGGLLTKGMKHRASIMSVASTGSPLAGLDPNYPSNSTTHHQAVAHCIDGVQNADETGVDCGGSCHNACPVDCVVSETTCTCTPNCGSTCTCTDTITVTTPAAGGGQACLSGATRTYTGGACPTCSDGVQNQAETGVDCGGPCTACPTCSDGVQNQAETGVDCGGPCAACPTCSDGVQNGAETGVDCGGPCTACRERYVFADTPALKTAVDLWVSDRTAALAMYGHISTDWDTSEVTSMRSLFEKHRCPLCEQFNDPIGAWNTSNSDGYEQNVRTGPRL